MVAYVVAKVFGYQDIELRNRKDELRLFFEAVLIILVAFEEKLLAAANVSTYSTRAEFLSHYPEFEGLPEDELIKLHEFANWMKYSKILIPPKWAKGHLLGGPIADSSTNHPFLSVFHVEFRYRYSTHRRSNDTEGQIYHGQLADSVDRSTRANIHERNR